MADDEEARILATINKKQNSAFEQRRRDALKHAHGDAAKNFHLVEEEKKKYIREKMLLYFLNHQVIYLQIVLILMHLLIEPY